MLNDATALLIYRAAVLAAAGSFSLVADAPILVLAAVGGLVAGYALARLYLVASAFVRDPASGTVLQFVSTFGVWLLSERLGLSPIITVVVYAMTLAQAAPGQLGTRLRISSYSVWETAVFVVNVLARPRRPAGFKESRRRHRPGLERHARPYHSGDCICIAAAISWARSDCPVRVLRGPGHARDPGLYAAAVNEIAPFRGRWCRRG